MDALLSLSRGIDRLNMFLGRVAALLVLAAALISAGNAIMRYAFDYSSNAFLEIQWYLFAGVVMLGAANTLRRNEHVRVDLVYMSVSDRARLWIDVFGILLFLFPFTLLLAWLSWPIAIRALQTGEMSSSAGGLLRWPVRMVICVGFALVALQGLSELIKRIAALRGALALSTDYEKPQQ
ncbi:TRAP dicarboxylate transporter, DctQ subunit, unknown substrate 6 [Rubellimicrobium mesophilum DSM 19309]|uniref:TRAP transporter small permease protein n=1 Tax=Rubellimicrobium mesophilum DSM 19309 TaxID=442562 RepID=A0A017HKZ1_9RHOB|nr:TRAP transporter small permease subunit [Rubellimicrobium mesophilum]EYD74449.1 TRAP dicarboxylate transporter, DctQ subunit, unknown substrate 6 [Rubellimicrobium mesophilum DSM 19309]